MTRLVTRNVPSASGRTTMRLEPEFWDALEDVAGKDGKDIGAIIDAAVAGAGDDAGRTSAVRVYLLVYYRQRANSSGERRS